MIKILRDLRKSKGETQYDIAKLLGLKTASAYNRIENGKIPISLDKAIILSDHYGVSMDVIVERNVEEAMRQ